MNEDVAYWVEMARYDLGTAEAALQTGRYVAVVVQCQQALEKLLKALVVQVQQQMPPRIHGLVELAQLAGLELDEDHMSVMDDLTKLYLDARYPPDVEHFRQLDDADVARDYIRQTKKVYEWLLQKIK